MVHRKIEIIRGVVVGLSQVIDFISRDGKPNHSITEMKNWIDSYLGEIYEGDIEDFRNDKEMALPKRIQIDHFKNISEIFEDIKSQNHNAFSEIRFQFLEVFIDDTRIHTWPCCSKLHNEKFIIGFNQGKISFNHRILHEVTTLNNFGKEDQSKDEEILGWGFQPEIQSILMWNECIACT